MYYFRTLTKLHKLKHFQSFTIDTIQILFQVRKNRKSLLRHSSANTILLFCEKDCSCEISNGILIADYNVTITIMTQ